MILIGNGSSNWINGDYLKKGRSALDVKKNENIRFSLRWGISFIFFFLELSA